MLLFCTYRYWVCQCVVCCMKPYRISITCESSLWTLRPEFCAATTVKGLGVGCTLRLLLSSSGTQRLCSPMDEEEGHKGECSRASHSAGGPVMADRMDTLSSYLLPYDVWSNAVTWAEKFLDCNVKCCKRCKIIINVNILPLSWFGNWTYGSIWESQSKHSVRPSKAQ